MPDSWLIAADTGGTFTDCWARDPQGSEHRCKVLSSGAVRSCIAEIISPKSIKLSHDWGLPNGFFGGFDVRFLKYPDISHRVFGWNARQCLLEFSEKIPCGLSPGDALELATGEAAPVLGARILTHTRLDEAFPPLEFRLATTLATNALLEGKNAPTLFCVTKGFGDLLEIGDQRRPALFALGHRKHKSLAAAVLEVAERIDAAGNVLVEPDRAVILAEARRCFDAGLRVAAVALLNSFRNPAHEKIVAECLRQAGFSTISISAEVSPLIRLLPRAETAVVDASLAPVMEKFVAEVRAPLGTAAERFSILTSAGGLCAEAEFRPKDSLLSGPAGGVAGCAAIAKQTGRTKILTFDMGGTSTDVARWEGSLLYQFEQKVGSASILGTSLRIQTVAAGGGSICHVTPEGLAVGPHSAGASPGPACYGAGGPLTVTDVNLLLGNIDPAKAAVPLWEAPARQRLEELKQSLVAHGWPLPTTDRELLEGLLEIAVERMAEAVRNISVREGCDPAEYTLLAFGGAGPQHACAIAERLGIQEIIVPRDAGLLSARGAAASRHERVVARQVLLPPTDLALPQILHELRQECHTQFPQGTELRQLAEIRLLGQETALTLDFSSLDDLPELFAAAYHRLYGYAVPLRRELEVVTLRVVASEPEETPPMEDFSDAKQIVGPLLLSDAFSTLVLAEGWSARQGTLGSWLLRREKSAAQLQARRSEAVEAEIFRCRFAGLVDGMGALLQRTAISTNVKERLDFSCALLDSAGNLVMNAPHIPVHLGALGECVRRVVARVPPQPGDLLVTNDPGCAGSHLPDVTVICPVFDDAGELLGYTANRAHHAEIGGISPGSMPASAGNLEEEGVLISPMLLARGEEYFEEAIRQVLTCAKYPTRNVADNLADLRAQAAAARHGAEALLKLCRWQGSAVVRQQLRHLTSVASQALRRKLAAMPEAALEAEEWLDDGWKIRVKFEKIGPRLRIDLTGSGPVHPGSRNATSAVVRSAVLYVLRLWLAEDLPLNEGILENVDLVVPPGFLNPTFGADPSKNPAVVAGNVETSQRLVDTLLKALRLEACSQGTMNNTIFGNARFGHYETLCGGSGAGRSYAGASALHTHMTNTAITDPEIIEHRYPVRITEFSIRRGSGGAGAWRGGDGVVREYQFLEAATVSLLTEHRRSGPYGMEGGSEGQPGRQTLLRGNTAEELPGNATFEVQPGDRVRVETPGGGGWGVAI